LLIRSAAVCLHDDTVTSAVVSFGGLKLIPVVPLVDDASDAR